jgi:hypothetical protein
MRGCITKYPLLFLLISGCAFGRASATPCMVEGFAVGRARLHATCSVGKSMERPALPEIPKVSVPMPIAGCPGRYTYLHECIDDPPPAPPEVHDRDLAKIDEGYVEISGGSPSTGFWSTAFDFLGLVATVLASKFAL